MSNNNIHAVDFYLKYPLAHVKNYNSKMVNRLDNNEIKPFIFSNNIESWSALNSWDPLFFKEKYGHLEFNVNPDLPDKAAPYLYNSKMYTTLMKLSDFIKLMSKNKSCYLAQESMQAFEDLKENFDFYDLIPSINYNHDVFVNLWMGANTRSGLHFDNLDNFLVQIYGVKKVILIPPDDAAFVYPISYNFSKCYVNPFEPNFKKFPKFKKARIFEGELKPGDVLFIPRGWYHYIYSPRQSISLNCWYGSSLTCKDYLITFYRSGWQSWLTIFKDFIWHGILSFPFEDKLYAGPPMGNFIYYLAIMKVRRLYGKIITFIKKTISF